MITIGEAIASLRPGAEFVLYGEDVENIIWHTPDVEPLTVEEVAAEIKRLEETLFAEEEARIAAKESAMAKLAALGLNEDEVQAIVGA